jgi:signal transduction histidine kinase
MMETIAPSKSSAVLRVLCLEGSFCDAERLELELRRQGYEPELHRIDTMQKLERELEREWELVLCDHRPPALDAFSALVQIQRRGLDLPFIVVSSGIDEALGVEVMRAGAHDFLFKDSLGRLGAVIDRELREASMRAQSRRLQQQLLLADRLTSVGMLAAGVAHEINNPLAYVLGNLEFALSRLKPQAPVEPEVVNALQHARDGSERIRLTTRDLRVFCRSDDNVAKAVDVRKVMESSINMAWGEIRHRARLSMDFAAIPNVAGNENRLGQVFLNLLVNAAQATPEGRVDENEIAVRIRAREGKVVIEVQDTGSGISAAQLKRIFEPFYTTKPAGVGSGIGLSVCESIVAELHGNIEVESSPGRGTTFRVTLPALSVALNASPASEPETVYLPRSRLLVIDDEPALCAVLRRLLSSEHDVRTFGSARDALQLLRRDGFFDVIFCDLMMPNMSGMAFFEELSELDPELAARTVFVTGGALSGPSRQFLGSVSNLVVEKPFEARTLQLAIARVLEIYPRSGTWPMRETSQAV